MLFERILKKADLLLQLADPNEFTLFLKKSLCIEVVAELILKSSI